MTKTTVTTPTPRPEGLGATVLLETTDHVNAAMAELRWCLQRRDVIDSGLNELHIAVSDKRPGLITFEIDGQWLTLDERAKSLHDAIKAWAVEHLKEHLAKDERTLKLDQGEVNVLALPAAIEPTPAIVAAAEKAKKSVDELIFAKINKAAPFLDRVLAIVNTWLNQAKKLLLGDVVKLKPELNKAGLLAAFKAKKLDAKSLKSLGLQVDDQREKFDFKLKP